MKFGKLMEAYREDPSLYGVENKQRLNLSDACHSVLLRDLDLFCPEEDAQRGIGSTLINHIFRVFREDARSSIHRSCRRKEAQLHSSLAQLEDPARSTAVALLVNAYREESKECVRQLLAEKGNQIVFRVSADNMKYLAFNGPGEPAEEERYTGQKERDFYGEHVGSYIKAVLEEYARRPPVEREMIFRKEILDTIREVMAEGVLLRLTRKNGTCTYVKPYRFCEDIDHQHCYLAGYASADQSGPWVPASIRISSVVSCKGIGRSGYLSAEKKALLDNAIEQGGIEFLSDHQDGEARETIVVRFTAAGERMYHRVLHLRPKRTAYDPATRTAEFNCTISQAEFYFLRYADKVQILSPEGLVKRIHKAHRRAAQQYET